MLLCGYFCIITSEKMTASQALVQYKGRDISEKLFRSDKTFIGSFGLDETDISRNAEEYSKMLTATQSFMNKEEPDDGEEEID
ncbi:hypothetical protein SAMN02910262_02260 [[Clostridium] aminophilum]|uniref:Uncharacterized protein n=1 Tax=[Clostridium] aminophilum TaxID=1526 RepID=A0A1I6K588_9FIRM|nr:hypothetical protein [[Clostridium] aminophilum]SFR86357.1 hypothetical protein SAMN02910262_02260 [[Clostridium] aminophilum]